MTLARELGLAINKPTPAEARERRERRQEAERFTEWARRKRIATAALLRDLDRYEVGWREQGRAELAAGQPVSERVSGKLQALTAWQEKAESRWRRCVTLKRTRPNCTRNL